MKFSKTSVIVLLLLLAIIGAEFYYYKYQTKEGKKSTLAVESNISTSQEQSTTKEHFTPAEIPDKLTEKEGVFTDEKIISTVTAYQKGYKEGCQKASETNTTATQTESHYERAYLLGFEKGKTECLSQIKQKKENYDLGYKDGCNSAIGKLVKDAALYQSSADYKKGWERGAEKCGNENEKMLAKKLKERKKVNKKSPDYQSGYRHGCSSAKGNYYRQEDIYLQSRDYRQGWTYGRQKCKSAKSKSTKKSLTPTQKRHYFDQGYRDGCDSVRGFYRRNHYKYKNIMSYKEGWRAGEFECSGY